jgi:hypothetical protein
MAVVVPNNPLSAIGQSNDPTLTQRTVDSNKSLLDLQRGLAQIQQTGMNQQRNTKLAGDLTMDNTALGLGVTHRLSPEGVKSLHQIATDNSNLAKGQANNQNASAFGQRAGAYGTLKDLAGIDMTVTPGMTGEQFVAPENTVSSRGKTGKELTAEGHGYKAAKLVATKGSETTIDDVVIPGTNITLGAAKRKRKQSESVTGTVQGGAAKAGATAVIDAVMGSQLATIASKLPQAEGRSIKDISPDPDNPGVAIVTFNDDTTASLRYQ